MPQPTTGLEIDIGGSAVKGAPVNLRSGEFLRDRLKIDGHDAESRASSAARKRDGLSCLEWATERLQRYYRVVEDLVWPDLIVVGGGVSRKSDRFLPHLDIRTPIVPAALLNTAGIVGAAQATAQDARPS